MACCTRSLDEAQNRAARWRPQLAPAYMKRYYLNELMVGG